MPKEQTLRGSGQNSVQNVETRKSEIKLKLERIDHLLSEDGLNAYINQIGQKIKFYQRELGQVNQGATRFQTLTDLLENRVKENENLQNNKERFQTYVLEIAKANKNSPEFTPEYKEKFQNLLNRESNFYKKELAHLRKAKLAKKWNRGPETPKTQVSKLELEIVNELAANGALIKSNGLSKYTRDLETKKARYQKELTELESQIPVQPDTRSQKDGVSQKDTGFPEDQELPDRLLGQTSGLKKELNEALSFSEEMLRERERNMSAPEKQIINNLISFYKLELRQLDLRPPRETNLLDLLKKRLSDNLELKGDDLKRLEFIQNRLTSRSNNNLGVIPTKEEFEKFSNLVDRVVILCEREINRITELDMQASSKIPKDQSTELQAELIEALSFAQKLLARQNDFDAPRAQFINSLVNFYRHELTLLNNNPSRESTLEALLQNRLSENKTLQNDRQKLREFMAQRASAKNKNGVITRDNEEKFLKLVDRIVAICEQELARLASQKIQGRKEESIGLRDQLSGLKLEIIHELLAAKNSRSALRVHWNKGSQGRIRRLNARIQFYDKELNKSGRSLPDTVRNLEELLDHRMQNMNIQWKELSKSNLSSKALKKCQKEFSDLSNFYTSEKNRLQRSLAEQPREQMSFKENSEAFDLLNEVLEYESPLGFASVNQILTQSDESYLAAMDPKQSYLFAENPPQKQEEQEEQEKRKPEFETAAFGRPSIQRLPTPTKENKTDGGKPPLHPDIGRNRRSFSNGSSGRGKCK